MKKRWFVTMGTAIVGATFAIVPGTDAAATNNSGTMEVIANGFRNDNGHAYVRVYRRHDKITDPPWRSIRMPIVSKEAHFKVPDLAYDAYALVVHHDENDNGRIEHNLLGLPAEPLGFSNGFTLGVFSGMPTFEKLRVVFTEKSRPLRVTVR
ncbi:DUF2141 domain-containing protein [Sorangium sp. So ce363]|uniref:DUF2141 domain-containing protein n=1 Tax=Sorangium sp. So ce363 TaxID=3133304 RepID=UPI003F60576B